VSKSLTAEIFVLNYNGESLLPICMPSLIEAVKRASVPCRLTVIDNDSTDGSVEMLRKNYPAANLRSSENRVFCSFNDAVRDSEADIVLLLNNDMKVEPDFIDPLVEVFRQYPDAFLAGPKALKFSLGKKGEADGEYDGSLSVMDFRNGILRAESRFPGYQRKMDTPGITMLAGGFAAYHRERFLELGGFDDLYLPGTVEDADLCFRAWRAGYSCYYEPKSRVYHIGQVSFIKRFGESRILTLNQRNLHLFVWKNTSSPFLWAQYLLWYAPRPIYFLLRGRPEFLRGQFLALGRLGQALKRRRSLRAALRVRADREIFDISKEITAKKVTLTAVIIALNEEKNIADCLTALKFADEIVVVDSGSIDRTAEIARALGARVFTRNFDNFSSQKNYAVDQASGEWVLSVDADERVTPELAAEIRGVLSRPDQADAYQISRRTNLFGREFRFSGLQKDAPVRLFRKDRAKFVQPVHERVEVNGNVGKLRCFLRHQSFQTPEEHRKRLELYTSLETAKPGPLDFLRPGLRFFRVYYLGQGFRDGKEGRLYAELSAEYERVRWKKITKKDRVQ